jgi:DNA-binding CsgD family transcriptional regulator
MSSQCDDSPDGARLTSLARRIRDLGAEIDLPYVAATADISSPDPMRDSAGRAFAETLFQWLDPKLEYWKDRSFALRAPFITAARYTAEPFFYHEGRFASWRPSPTLDGIEVEAAARAFGVAAAIIAPTYLPGGVIGAVVWAASDERPNLPEVFETHAATLQAAALRFMAAYHDSHGAAAAPVRLTRREIQCLKWAAAGKTDQEVGAIIEISLPTVRFHVRNAAEKLGVPGRAQAIHRAATLGYIGATPGTLAHD